MTIPTSAKSWIIQQQMWRGKTQYVVHIKYKRQIIATLEIDERTYHNLMHADINSLSD